jgi:hypothetical protein
MRTETLEHLSWVVTVVGGALVVLGTIGGYHFGKKAQAEKDAVAARLQAERDSKASEREAALRAQVEAVRDYAQISRLNPNGVTGAVKPPLVEQSAISRALVGAVKISGDDLQYLCDPAALQKFRDVISLNPRFPFPYVALALCLRQQGDPSWRDLAVKAVEILRKTTAIDGHHAAHDHALSELEKALGS